MTILFDVFPKAAVIVIAIHQLPGCWLTPLFYSTLKELWLWCLLLLMSSKLLRFSI